jgi:hypothetical protein
LAIAHQTEFHQFMLYTPIPGTPLYKDMLEQGRLLDGIDLADIHGQHKFNFRHAAISRDQSKKFLDWAFQRDYDLNGPSLYRTCRTMLQGWRRYKNYPDGRVRARFEREAEQLKKSAGAALWAMERRLRSANPPVSKGIRQLRHEIEAEFGPLTRWVARVAGPVLLWMTHREERRLAKGEIEEPALIVERRNWAGAQ